MICNYNTYKVIEFRILTKFVQILKNTSCCVVRNTYKI